MPFKSQAQRAKFGELVAQGKMIQSVFDEWNSATPKNIPERVKVKKSLLNKTASKPKSSIWNLIKKE